MVRPDGKPDDIDLAVWWVLGRPEVFLNSVSDMDLLPLVLDAAARYASRPSDEEMQSLMTTAGSRTPVRLGHVYAPSGRRPIPRVQRSSDAGEPPVLVGPGTRGLG